MIVKKIEIILIKSKTIRTSYEKSMLRKLSKINYLSSKCIRNNDLLLQIGDNDSGCFFPFNIYQILCEKKYLHRALSLPSFKIPFYTFLKKQELNKVFASENVTYAGIKKCGISDILNIEMIRLKMYFDGEC